MAAGIFDQKVVRSTSAMLEGAYARCQEGKVSEIETKIEIKDWWWDGDDIILQVRATDELIRCVKPYLTSVVYSGLDYSNSDFCEIETTMVYPNSKWEG